MKSFLIATAAVLVVLAGCASTEGAAPEQPSTTDRVYRPGSNILVKDRTPQTKEEKDQQAEDARKILTVTPRPTVIK